MPRSLIVGSQEHKELFCQFFLDTHVAFDPATIHWPEIDEDSLKRLHSLPVWNEAVATECAATCIIQTWAPFETDAVIREAVALQGYEEARHAAIIQGLTTHYGMPVSPPPPRQRQRTLNGPLCAWGTASVLTPFLPLPCLPSPEIRAFSHQVLVEKFEPVMQEEARHILFLSIGKPIARLRGRSGSALAITGAAPLDASCRCGVGCKAPWAHVLTRISP